VRSFIKVQWAPASSVNFVFQVTMPGFEKSFDGLDVDFLAFLFFVGVVTPDGAFDG
jgi:hypothetical protein